MAERWSCSRRGTSRPSTPVGPGSVRCGGTARGPPRRWPRLAPRAAGVTHVVATARAVRRCNTARVPTINERASVAADAATAEAALRDLATDTSPKVRAAVAGNASTPRDVLVRLAEDARFSVRFAVAENPHPAALEVALRSSDPDTRGLAAQRRDLDTAQLALVMADPSPTVRERLGEATADPAVVAALARDVHPMVRASVASNPRLTEDDLELLARDPVARVRATAAASGRLPTATVLRMTRDRSALVRWWVLVCNDDRDGVAVAMLDDPDETNAQLARARVEHPETVSARVGTERLFAELGEPSDDQRAAWRRLLGEDPGAPPLTAEDAEGLLRVLHDHATGQSGASPGAD